MNLEELEKMNNNNKLEEVEQSATPILEESLPTIEPVDVKTHDLTNTVEAIKNGVEIPVEEPIVDTPVEEPVVDTPVEETADLSETVEVVNIYPTNKENNDKLEKYLNDSFDDKDYQSIRTIAQPKENLYTKTTKLRNELLKKPEKEPMIETSVEESMVDTPIEEDAKVKELGGIAAFSQVWLISILTSVASVGIIIFGVAFLTR